MKILSFDIETFSDVDLINCGVYAYADSSNFEILLFAYAFDEDKIQIVDLSSREELPEKLWRFCWIMRLQRWFLMPYLNASAYPGILVFHSQAKAAI